MLYTGVRIDILYFKKESFLVLDLSKVNLIKYSFNLDVNMKEKPNFLYYWKRNQSLESMKDFIFGEPKAC